MRPPLTCPPLYLMPAKAAVLLGPSGWGSCPECCQNWIYIKRRSPCVAMKQVPKERRAESVLDRLGTPSEFALSDSRYCRFGTRLEMTALKAEGQVIEDPTARLVRSLLNHTAWDNNVMVGELAVIHTY
jgi:hypothetical protein